MQKIAILSDIHANLPALEAVLRDVEQCGAGRFVFLGDIVGYGASPAECVDRVRELGGECAMGNHDLAIKRVRMRGRRGMSPGWEQSGYFAGLVHAAASLDGEQAAWLESLPFTLRIHGAIAAHANLHEPEGFESITDAASAALTLRKLMGESSKTGFFGHTHLQQVFPDPCGEIEWLDDTRFHVPVDLPCAVMVGSVGQPLEVTDLRAAWVLWDPVARVAELRKTDYDRFRAARDIVNTGLPLESARRLLTEEEATLL